MKKLLFTGMALLLAVGISSTSVSNEPERFWIKVKADNSIERTVIANTGLAIEGEREGYVFGTGTAEELQLLQKSGRVESFFPLTEEMILDFPDKDSSFHNYEEMVAAIKTMAVNNSDVAEVIEIGQSVQGRPIVGLRISTNLPTANQKPGIFFVGGHHAREHLSVETPLRLTQNLLRDYRAGVPRIVGLVESREITVVPGLNPDGLEYDIEGGSYKSWRKNRRLNTNKTYGVDLNRNYGFKWGTGGSSKDPRSDTYMGPAPFSEPETSAVRYYLENNRQITTVLSFHTFSELILYPWGHKNESVDNLRDRQVYEVMSRTMARWNNYTPQRSSDLYIASGDMTDWTYGALGIFSFTFELDPKNQWGGGGFYPGQGVIPEVVRKNTEPFLYLIEHADNPYRVITMHPYRPYY